MGLEVRSDPVREHEEERRGRHDRDRGTGRRADPPSQQFAELPRRQAPADPAEDDDESPADDQITLVTREPVLRHRRDFEEPEDRHDGKDEHDALGTVALLAHRRADPRRPAPQRPPDRDRRAHRRQGGDDLDPRERDLRCGLHLRAERALRERGRAFARMQRACHAAEEVARPPQLGQEPQAGDEHEQRHDELSCARIAAAQIQAVESPECPYLRTIERRNDAKEERLARLVVQMAVDREQHDARSQALRVAERRVADVLGGDEHAERRDPAREHGRAVRDRAGDASAPTRAGAKPQRQPRRELECHRHREKSSRPPDREPQVGLSLAEQRERQREDHGERLERIGAHRVQLEMEDLPSPQEPSPRVIARGRGIQQRERPEGERAQREREVQPPGGRARAPGSACRWALGVRGRECGQRSGRGRHARAHASVAKTEGAGAAAPTREGPPKRALSANTVGGTRRTKRRRARWDTVLGPLPATGRRDVRPWRLRTEPVARREKRFKLARGLREPGC